MCFAESKVTGFVSRFFYFFFFSRPFFFAATAFVFHGMYSHIVLFIVLIWWFESHLRDFLFLAAAVVSPREYDGHMDLLLFFFFFLFSFILLPLADRLRCIYEAGVEFMRQIPKQAHHWPSSYS